MNYELTLKGAWPVARYDALKSVLGDLVALLAQLQFIMSTLNPHWRHALLKRTRLLDSRFVSF